MESTAEIVNPKSNEKDQASVAESMAQIVNQKTTNETDKPRVDGDDLHWCRLFFRREECRLHGCIWRGFDRCLSPDATVYPAEPAMVAVESTAESMAQIVNQKTTNETDK